MGPIIQATSIKRDIFFFGTGSKSLLHIDIVNTHLHYSNQLLWPTTSVMSFKSTHITLNGHNYFSVNRGRILRVEHSDLTISGNLTMCGANAQGFIVPGGAIIIKQLSNIFLKEPLEARFCDNRAIQGSAIYVAEDSRMYIQPNRLYSLKNTYHQNRDCTLLQK